MTYKIQVDRLLGLLVLVPGAIVLLFPAIWMLLGSFQHNNQIISFPPNLWPKPWTWNGYFKGLQTLPFARYFSNTLLIAILSTAGGILSSSIVGFAFAKLRAPGKNIWFVLVLSGLMVPYAVVMIPQYMLFRQLGWINTYLPLIVPAWLGLPFLIFLFRQFFASIPNELFEAARVDGCGYIRLYRQMALPMSIPAIAAAFVFHFQASWNDFLGPLIYLNSSIKYTLSLGLAAFTSSCDCTPWNQLMAVSAIVTLVPILLFFTAQKYILRGITLTSK